VKRVIGPPGDSIALRNNHLLVNGEAAAYETVDQSNPRMSVAADQFCVMEDLTGRKHPVQITPRQPALRTFGPVTVLTYGQVAALADTPRTARQVGRILYPNGRSVPWQKVIN
jgi:signal peptidase I